MPDGDGAWKHAICASCIFTQMLDEETGREEGLAHGLEVLARCDELHYWGAISPGMRREIEYAESAGIPVVCMTGGEDD